MMLTCKCGFSADVDATFCEACGEAFDRSDLGPAAARATPSAAQTPDAAAASGTNGHPTVNPTVRPSSPATTPPDAAAPPPRPACTCGATADKIDAQGVCTVCGDIVESLDTQSRAHMFIRVDDRCAANSDIGRHHHQNEDFVALARSGTSVFFAVSDGVSSSEHAEEASQRGCEAALAAMREAVARGRADEALKRAVDAAQTAVLTIPYSGDAHKEPPEATLIVGMMDGTNLSVGWLGDSRVYAVSQQDGEVKVSQITEDHSWVNEMVAAGTMTIEEASADPRAHAITQSLGEVVEGDELRPSFKTVPLQGTSWVVACSDGFWNYAHPADDAQARPFADLVRARAADEEALGLARRCVDFANQSGGHDNITVVVIDVRNS